MSNLSKSNIDTFLQTNNDWALKNNGIEKYFVFKDFASAFAFLTKVALLSEKMNHHPNWSGVYNKVHIRLTTHDIGGLSQLDIAMAKEIDLL